MAFVGWVMYTRPLNVDYVEGNMVRTVTHSSGWVNVMYLLHEVGQRRAVVKVEAATQVVVEAG